MRLVRLNDNLSYDCERKRSALEHFLSIDSPGGRSRSCANQKSILSEGRDHKSVFNATRSVKNEDLERSWLANYERCRQSSPSTQRSTGRENGEHSYKYRD